MERDIVKKVFFVDDYCSKANMEEHIKEYIRKLKLEYPDLIITREFYKNNNVLVRATQINIIDRSQKIQDEMQQELEQEEIRIKEIGIKGIRENSNRETKYNKLRERICGGGSVRERGGR